MATVTRRQKIRQALAVTLTLLFPVVFYYMSPYLAIMGAAEGIIAGDVLFFAGLFAVSLFTGRAFCGWLCPAGAMQDLCGRVNHKSYNSKKRNLIKYLIWVPWVAIIILMFVQAGGVVSVNPLYQTRNGISISDEGSAIMFAIVAGAIAALALIAGKRAECHSVCWMAPFMIAGTKLKNALGYPSLHLLADNSHCALCKQCNSHCPMSLDVAEMVQKQDMTNMECILCGSCVDSCPRKAIKFAFSGPNKKC